MTTIISEGPIRVSMEGPIKTISFHQPDKKNAISVEMSRTFRDIVLQTKNDDSRVIILTGYGNDFCAGADLDPALLNQGPFDVTQFLRETYNPLVLAMREMDKVFIAKVRGSCVGVGFNFALACDLIYAAESATFSQIFPRIGLSSDGGGAYFMAEKLGYHKAFELMATGELLSGSQAEELGLINQLLPEDQLDQAVIQMAQRLAEGPYLAIQHTKANLRAGQQGGLAAALESEAVNQGKNFLSKDFFEGIAAFLQKRKARFKGK